MKHWNGPGTGAVYVSNAHGLMHPNKPRDLSVSTADARMRTMLSSASFCFVLPPPPSSSHTCNANRCAAKVHTAVQPVSWPPLVREYLSSCGSSKRTKLRAGLLNGHTAVFQSSSHVVPFCAGCFVHAAPTNTACTYVVNHQLRGRYTRHEVHFMNVLF